MKAIANSWLWAILPCTQALMHARWVLDHTTTLLVHSDLFQFIFHLLPNRKSIPIQGEVELSRVKRLKPEYNFMPSMYKVLGSSTTQRKGKSCLQLQTSLSTPCSLTSLMTTSGEPTQVSKTFHSLCQLHESHLLHISHSICSPVTLSKNKLVTSDCCPCGTTNHINTKATQAF